MKGPEEWEKALAALYACAMDGRGFSEVNRTSMETEKADFGWTLYILQMKGLIEGCVFQPPAPADKDQTMGVLRDGLLLTPAGFKEMERRFGDRKGAALTGIWHFLRDAGCQMFAETVYRWIS